MQMRNDNPLNINRIEGWTTSSTLGVHITEGLIWKLHTDSVVRKARHLRHLRKFRYPHKY